MNIYDLAQIIKIGKYTTGQVIALFATPIVYSSIFIGFGFLLFNKKDLK